MKLGGGRGFGQGCEGRRHHALPGPGTAFDHRRRRRRIGAVFDEALRDGGQRGQPHVDRDGLVGLDQRLPIELGHSILAVSRPPWPQSDLRFDAAALFVEAVVKDTLGGATIRRAVESDAEEISLMARELFDYLRSLDEEPEAFEQAPFPPQTILRHGFGKRPWFHGLIAEHDGKLVGYLLYHFGYWAEDALPSLHVADLFVREAARGRKIGFALMAEAARIIRQQGGKRVLWTVWSRNRAAVDFYRSLRARFTDDEPLMTWTSENWPE